MAILRNDTVVKSADGQHSSAIITAANIGSHSIAPNSTYFIGTTQNVFNRASGAQTLTGVNIDGNSGGIYAAGGASIKSSTTGTAYTSHIQIREADGGGSNTSEIYAPALGFHWAGVVASNILMESSGRIAIRNNPGSGYENFIAAIIYAGSSVQAPIFYDSNNTSYYLDPANSGTSLLVAGSIGAGLTTPLHKIQASGLISASDATYNNDSTFIGAILNNDGTNPGLDLRRWNGGAAGTNNHGTTYIATNSAGDTIFYNGLIAANTRATNEKMRIAVNGNVGIGTTSPGSKLDVNGTFRTAINNLTIFNDYIYVSPTENNTLNSAYFTNGIADMWINYAGYNNGNTQFRNFNIGNGRNGVIAWFDGTNKRVSINNNQAASYPLHVVGTAYSDTDFRAPIFYDSANTAYYLDAANSGTSLLVAGKVGIGTTSPAYKLDVGASGSDAISVRLTPGFERVRYYGFDLLGYNDGNLWMIGNNATNTLVLGGSWDWDRQIAIAYTPATTGAAGGSLEIGQMTKNNANFTHGNTRFYTNGIERVRINSSGNVGIGTTSPSNPLHINTSANEGILVQGSTAGSWMNFKSSTSNLLSIGADGTLGLGFYNRTSSTYLAIISNSGSLGIGTTSPSQKLHVVGTGFASTDFRAPIFYDSDNTTYYLDPNASTSGNLFGVLKQNDGKFVRDSYFRTISGVGDYYASGASGWYTVASITLTTNCTGGVLYGTLYDNRYDGADTYQIAIVARAECDFTTNNESHYVNVGCTILGSTNIINYQSKIRVLLVASSTNSRTYEVQFLETAWNRDTWQLETGGSPVWTIYSTAQAPGTSTGTARVFYISNKNADNIRANTASYSPIYYDSSDTSYYSDPAGLNRFNALNIGNQGALTGNTTYALGAYHNSRYMVGLRYSSGGAAYPWLVHDSWNGSAFIIHFNGVGDRFHVSESGIAYVTGDFRAPIFYDSNNTSYYLDPASTSNLNALTVAGGNATIYRDLIVNGGASGSFGNRIIVQGTATTYTLQDTTFRPTVYLNGDYPVVTLNCSATTNTNHGPTLQFAFNGLTTGGSTSRQVVIGANGIGSWLDFGFSGGANGDNTSYNPHNGIAGYNGITPMRLFSNGLLLGSTGAFPNHITSTSFALDVRGAGSSNTDFRAPIFYDSNDTNYYIDPASTSLLNTLRLAGSLQNNGSVSDDDNFGIYWDSGGSSAYAIYREAGSWTNPFPDLRIAFHTGIKIGANAGYNGVRFYDDYGMANQVMSVNNSSDGLGANNVYVNNALQAGGSLRAPIFYDSNDTTYYTDPSSLSNILELKTNKNWYDSSASVWGGGINMAGNSPSIGFQSTSSTWWYMLHHSSSAINFYRRSTSGSWNHDGIWDSSGNFIWQGSSVRAPIFYDQNNTAYYIDAASTSNLVGLTVANTITGSISGNAATATNVTWTGITQSTRTNYDLAFQPPSSGYAGFSFKTSAGGEAGYFLVRGTSDTDVYTAEGITLVADGGWLTLAQRTTASRGVRIMTGTTSSERLKITTAGDIQFVNGNSITYNGNVVLHAANYNSYSPTLTGTGASGTWGINITGSSASCTGNAATATRTSSQSGYPHAGTGMFAFYNWGGTDGGTSAPSASTYTTGISVGSNPGDQAYGFQIANNMWNTGLWTRNYNSSFGAWIRLLDSSNYVGYSAFTSSLTSTVDARAPIFYDSNDTGYYIDAASTSSLNSLISTEVYARNWFRNNDSGEGIYNQATTQHFYSDDVSYWNVASSSGVQGIRFRTGGHGGTVRGYVYANDSNDVGLLNNGGNWRIRVVAGDYTIFDGSSVRAQTFIDSNNTAYHVDPGSTSNLNNLNTVDGNLELYKSQTVDMSNTTTYSTSNYYPVTIPVPTEGCIIQIQNNLNSNVPSWATHGGGFTLNLRWRTNGSGWGTTEVRRYIEQYHERFANQTICGGITQMGNSSTEVVWLRGGGQYYFKFSRNLSATAQSATYTINSQSVSPTSTAQNTIWNGYSGYSILYNNQTVSTDNMYTPVLYDWNNSAYYVDPASTSNLVGLTVANTITGSVSGNAVTAGGLAVHSARNDEANKIVRTDSNGYIQAGWINTTSGDNGTTAIDRIYASSDAYIRYYTPANFRTVLDVPTRGGSGASGSWNISITGNSATVTNGVYTNTTNSLTGVNYFRSDKGSTSTVGANSNYALQAFSNDAGAAGMSFHRGGYYAVNMGLDPDNILRIGGWSAAADRWQLDMSGNNWVASSFRAPIFYDSNDTTYYVDPASTSNLVGLTVANTITGSITGNAGGSSASCTGNSATATTATNAGCVTSDTGNVGDSRLQYWQTSGNTTLNPDTEWYNAIRMGHGNPVTYYSNTLAVKMTGSNLGDIYTRTTTNGTAGTWNRFWNNNNDGAGSGLDADLLDGINSASFLRSDVSATNSVDLRSPIFYDSNNTAYYVDPSSTSNLVGLTVANTITGSITGNAGGSSASCSGNAATATILQTARTIGGVSFNGSANINLPGVNTAGNQNTTGTAANVTGTVAIANGGTGATTAAAARSNLGIPAAETSSNQSLSGSTTCTIDVAAANVHILALASGTTISSFTYNNRSASPLVNTILVVLKFAGTATVTWSNVVWSNGTTPTLTGVNGKADVYSLTSYKGGTTGPAWIGSVVGQNMDSTNL